MSRKLIRIGDCRALGYCCRGCKKFLLRHDLDWNKFLREGLPIEAFEKINDAMAFKVINSVRNENG